MTIQLTDLTKTYADRRVLDGIDLTVSPGSRVGLVGENGAGKSTLLRIAAGDDADYGGSVRVPSDLAYIAQDTGVDLDATLEQVLHDALAPLHDAVDRLAALAEQLSDIAGEPAADDRDAATAYDALLGWCGLHGAWDADRRAEQAAARLGLGRISPRRRAGTLSGGQRSRLALAAMIVRQPDAVVLDEPTNHLDDAALDFLEDRLRDMAGAVLVASHDRVFLDRVCTAIVDLDPSHFGTDGGGGRRYSGAYTQYLEHKRDSRRRWEQAFEAEQEQLADLRVAAHTDTTTIAHDRGPRDNDKFIYGFKGSRVQAAATRRARNAEQRIAVIERDPVPKPPAPLTFSGRFDAPTRAAATLADVEVEGRLRMDRLVVDPGDTVLVTGPNGSGKSTLLAVLAGRVRPDRGSVQVSARAVGLLTQDVELPDPSRTPIELYAEARRPSDGAPPLGRLGLLHPRDLRRPAGDLSLGQQRRLALAILLAGGSDLLLLDEPTNHLSLTLVDELEEALRRTPVTVVLASHDRWIRRRWHGREVSLAAPATSMNPSVTCR